MLHQQGKGWQLINRLVTQLKSVHQERLKERNQSQEVSIQYLLTTLRFSPWKAQSLEALQNNQPKNQNILLTTISQETTFLMLQERQQIIHLST